MNFLAQNIKIPGANDQPVNLSGLPNFSFSSLGTMLTKLIPFVFAFAGIGLLLMLLSSGFALLTSAGDPKKTAQAKGRLTNAILGVIIIFAAYWGVQIAGVMFGIPEFGQIFR